MKYGVGPGPKCGIRLGMLIHVFVFSFLKGMGIVSLGISLVIRLITTYLGLLGNDLNLKERLFIAIAWLPKATVQVSLLARSFRSHLCLP